MAKKGQLLKDFWKGQLKLFLELHHLDFGSMDDSMHDKDAWVIHRTVLLWLT